jgi:hypothetical protein
MVIEATLNDVVQTLDVTPTGDTAASVLSRLEAIMSGDEPQEKVEVTTEATEEPTGEEESDDSTETTDEDETEGEKDETEVDEKEEEAEALELEEDQIAELMGLSEGTVQVSEDGEMKIKAKVDGKEEFIPVKDLVTSYQLEKHLRNKSSADAEGRREFEAFKTTETQKLQHTMTDATALVQQLEQDFMATVKTANMDALRQQNPAEWAAKNQEFQHRAGRIQQAKGLIRQNIDSQQQAQTEMTATKKADYISTQTDLLLEKVPAWMDEKIATKEIGDMQKAVSDIYGFTAEEISQINDHRVILMLRDIVNSKAATDAAPIKKRLKKIPKIVKPGNKQSTVNASTKKAEQTKRNRARSTGSLRDVAAVLEDII